MFTNFRVESTVEKRLSELFGPFQISKLSIRHEQLIIEENSPFLYFIFEVYITAWVSFGLMLYRR